MSENRGEKRQIRVKKTNNDITKENTTDFKDGFILKTSFISRDDTDPININDIDFNKIKTSDKKLYRKNITHLDII